MAGEKVRVGTDRRVLKQVEKAPAEVEDAFFEMIDKIQAMTVTEIMADKGLDFEKDRKRKKINGWTLRISRGWRALCFLHGGSILEIYGIRDPTSAHSNLRRRARPYRGQDTNSRPRTRSSWIRV